MKLFISALHLPWKLPIEEGIFKDLCSFPLRPLNLPETQLHVVTFDLVKDCIQGRTNLDSSARI